MRDRYKILSSTKSTSCRNRSFNSLLKSIEEPPPHVVVMMATTELDKIPRDGASRAQVYEFRTIAPRKSPRTCGRSSTKKASPPATTPLQTHRARADGSMRDAQSKLDQVIAFTGTNHHPGRRVDGARSVGRDCCSTRCRRWPTRTRRLRSRSAARAWRWDTICARSAASWSGWGARPVLAVDPSRINDPEIAGEGGSAISAEGARRPLLARGTAARVRFC